jgi:hypothetical protein
MNEYDALEFPRDLYPIRIISRNKKLQNVPFFIYFRLKMAGDIEADGGGGDTNMADTIREGYSILFIIQINLLFI